MIPGWRSLGEDGGGGCPQKHLWTNHSLSTSSLPSVMYLQSVHWSAVSSAATSSWLGQWRPNKHLLEGWGHHPTTNSSLPGLGPPSTNQILTEEVFPAQDRHASHRALVQACREIEGGFIPGWRSLGKGGGARFSAKPFCFRK